MANDIYRISTIHTYGMLLYHGLSGTFSNLLIPLQIGARDMAPDL
jgi:heme/copper-type cytochrome/quinol oxidase subunit 1